ncbi:KINESIN-RELATED, partial [Salix viminalis]
MEEEESCPLLGSLVLVGRGNNPSPLTPSATASEPDDFLNPGSHPLSTPEVSPVAAVSITCEATILDTTDNDNNTIVLSTGELSMLDEGIPPHNDVFHTQTSTDIGEPRTLNSSMGVSNTDITSFSTWEKFTAGSTRMKNSLAQDYLRLLNTADKEVLKKLKGIGEKRATLILELREDSPEPFKNLDDLKVIGLSAKQ